MATLDDFESGAEIELALDGPWEWYRLMHCYNSGGGWVRKVIDEGPPVLIDESKTGARPLDGSTPVRGARRVRNRKQSKTKPKGYTDPNHY